MPDHIRREDVKPSFVDAVGAVLIRHGLHDREVHHTFALWCLVPGQTQSSQMTSFYRLLVHEGHDTTKVAEITTDVLSALASFLKEEGSPCLVPM